MPECYEVMRMAHYLTDNGFKETTIAHFEFCNRGERLLKNCNKAEFTSRLINQDLIHIQTKAKFTFIQLKYDVLEWHYRFTGIPHIENVPYNDRLYSIYTLPISSQTPQRHIRFKLFTSKGHCLNYVDTRCLSTLILYPNTLIDQTERYQSLADDLSQVQHIQTKDLKKFPNKRLKLFLQDQFTQPSGIGNYRACEICAYAKLNPFMLLKQISSQQVQHLNDALAMVHNHAMRTSTYDWFLVFNQAYCQRCGKAVTKKKFKPTEQTTHWCTRCQPIK